MKLITATSLLCLSVLTGCSVEHTNQPDQCLRQEILLLYVKQHYPEDHVMIAMVESL